MPCLFLFLLQASPFLPIMCHQMFMSLLLLFGLSPFLFFYNCFFSPDLITFYALHVWIWFVHMFVLFGGKHHLPGLHGYVTQVNFSPLSCPHSQCFHIFQSFGKYKDPSYYVIISQVIICITSHLDQAELTRTHQAWYNPTSHYVLTNHYEMQ